MADMNIKQIGIDDIFPYENNPRVNDRAVEIVAKSIEEFGFRNPIIVDKDMVIIAGHTRWRASKRLGLDVVPVMVADDLNEEQVKAFRIMDNKSSEFAEWDYVKLLEEVDSLKLADYDAELTGFDEVELEDILNDIAGDMEEKEKKKEKPELEFTEELLEEHNYVVLYFDNTLDWQVAKEVFELHPVMALWSKLDNEKFQRSGTGRVIKGAKYLEKLKALKEKGEL